MIPYNAGSLLAGTNYMENVNKPGWNGQDWPFGWPGGKAWEEQTNLGWT